jgi:hypothetical protein
VRVEQRREELEAASSSAGRSPVQVQPAATGAPTKWGRCDPRDRRRHLSSDVVSCRAGLTQALSVPE